MLGVLRFLSCGAGQEESHGGGGKGGMSSGNKRWLKKGEFECVIFRWKEVGAGGGGSGGHHKDEAELPFGQLIQKQM